ncbi:MAG: PD-(D/E)XK nuclease family protein [Methanomassiliicoccaceae archaeon]|nr:PD-(D/E)XK nuclease family protein [Methanomassiliicoccaceae archaeon]
MRRAKSIDELYEEVKGYDIVLTTDAALATALNAKIDVPRIGGFAYTPRHLAKDEAVPFFGVGALTDLQIITEIANERGFSLKYIHSELENIRNIRKYKKEVRRYLHTGPSKEVYDSFLALKTVENLMDSYTAESNLFFEGKKVAVIGLDFFDDLDKHFIPPGHKEIEIFTDETYEIETIYEIGNDRQLAENAVSLITKETANDTAIVLDTKGPIADAVRAALYRRDIPFKNTMAVRDLSQVRDFLQFLSLSLTYETLRVRHVRELFSGYRGFLDQRDDGYLLHKMEPLLTGREKELTLVAKNIREMTFQEACGKVVGDDHRPQITMLLDDMRLKDEKITSKLVNELAYAVNNVDGLHHNEEIPEEEKKGVLLADCSRSVYVDRPFVIYLGLGPEWSYVTMGKEYVDKEREAELNMFRFTVLMQQGVSRVYAVNSMRDGKESLPCGVFEQIRETEKQGGGPVSALRFKDVAKRIVRGQWASPAKDEPIMRGEEIIDSDESKEWKFYKSNYNNYFACPRAFMYGSMMHTPDVDKSLFGNIIHEFAEFYLCYPELIEGRIPEYTEMIRDKYSGMSSQQMKEIDWSRIRISMNNVMRFIDSLNLKNIPLDMDYSKRKYKNMFMDHHKCEKYSSMMEITLTSAAHPLSGKVDLVMGNRIVDYKTGKASSAKEIMNSMSMSGDQYYFEFQPLIYLSLLRENNKPPCRFSLVYVAANDVRSITDEDFSIRENIRDVFLLSENMREFISDPNSPVLSEFGKTYDKIRGGWSLFTDKAFEAGADSHKVWKENESLISSVLSVLGLKDNVTNRGMVTGALKKLSDIIEDGMYHDDNSVYVPSDTMEEFLSMIDKDHRSASAQKFTDFPASPRRDCTNCVFFKVCTRDVISLEEQEGEENE